MEPDLENEIPLNRPVLIEHEGGTRLYVFPHIEGGQCTGRTKQKHRCRNVVWDQGQVAAYGVGFVGAHMVRYYGPLSGSAARMYLHQRCRMHDTPDAAAFCDPEWAQFDPHRHSRFLTEPGLSELGEHLIKCRTPPIEAFGPALRAEYGETERRRLAGILLADLPRD